MTNWCWVEICKCRATADENILIRAASTYNNADYEYGYIGKGIDWDWDGLKEINCYDLVAFTLEQLGYHAPKAWHLKSEPSSVLFEKYFCRVNDIREARPGDIVYLDSKPGYSAFEHIGILASVPEQKDSVWEGWFYHAANKSQGMRFRGHNTYLTGVLAEPFGPGLRRLTKSEQNPRAPYLIGVTILNQVMCPQMDRSREFRNSGDSILISW